MRPWVKLPSGLVSEPDFTTLSIAARALYLGCFCGAGLYDRDGALAGNRGPVSPLMVQQWSGVEPTAQESAFAELQQAGYFVRRGVTWHIANWDQFPMTGTERSAKSRSKNNPKTRNENATKMQRTTATETRNENATDIDREIDINRERDDASSDGDASGVVLDFGHLEDEIQTYLELRAAENKTGRLTDAGVQRELRNLKAVHDEVGPEAFERALRMANEARKPNPNWVKKAALSAPRGRNGKPPRSNDSADYYPELVATQPIPEDTQLAIESLSDRPCSKFEADKAGVA